MSPFIADIHRKTKGENQTPMHYAAKSNAVEAINTLMELGASILDRDYKDQMPLFVAADAGLKSFHSKNLSDRKIRHKQLMLSSDH